MYTACRYLNSASLLLGFNVGDSSNSLSSGNRDSLPSAATLRITSVSSIGALFRVYCDVLVF